MQKSLVCDFFHTLGGPCDPFFQYILVQYADASETNPPFELALWRQKKLPVTDLANTFKQMAEKNLLAPPADYNPDVK